MNRSVRVLLGVAVATALAGCATSTAGSGTAAPGVTGGGAAGSPTTLPMPSGSGAAPTSAPPAPSGQRIQVGTASVPVPAGATVKQETNYACLVLADDDGCSLEVFDIGRTRAAGGSVSNPAPGDPAGWWWGSDVATCEKGDTFSAVAKTTVVTKGFKPVGPKNAAYGSWLVTCENADLNFDPQIWWLPASQLVFRQRSTVAGTSEAVAPILAGVTFSS